MNREKSDFSRITNQNSKKMDVKYLLCAIFAIVLVDEAKSFCFPCPREGVTFESFTNGDCPLSKFYDESTGKCVDYDACPQTPLKNPLPELRAIAPMAYEVVSNTLNSMSVNNVAPSKDLSLTMKALTKRFADLRKELPELISPVIAPVAVRNKDILGNCKGETKCIFKELLKRPENYDSIFPKMGPVMEEVSKRFMKIFGDLEGLSKECNAGRDGCPLIKGLLGLRSHLPGSFEELSDIHKITMQLTKYFVTHIKRNLTPA